MRAPSADHVASRSWASDERVRLRVTPSTGTEKHVAPCDDDGAFAAGLTSTIDVVGRVHGLRRDYGEVRRHRNRQRAVGVATGVVDMQFASSRTRSAVGVGTRQRTSQSV